MKLHINEAPAVMLNWFDSCILSKTPSAFIKTAATFAILSFQNSINNTVVSLLSNAADKDGYIDIDTFCDNLSKSISVVGDSVDVPLSMFTTIQIPFIKNTNITVTKEDIATMKELMTEKGVK